jgi:hypothetical protein
MHSSNEEPSIGQVPREQFPSLPQLWIGYLLGIATIAAELVAVALHPEFAKGEQAIPPLYLFLAIFVGWVYWLVCVYRYHEVMAHVRDWKHPISPARAAGFHLIPIYNLYWVFKWPQEIARFVNWRLQRPLMKPQMVGLAVFVALIVRFLIDPGLGLILLFVAASYVSECLRRALAAPSLPVPSVPPTAE